MTLKEKVPLLHERTVTGLIVLDVFEEEGSDSESSYVQHFQAQEVAEMFLLYSFICFFLFCFFKD